MRIVRGIVVVVIPGMFIVCLGDRVGCVRSILLMTLIVLIILVLIVVLVVIIGFDRLVVLFVFVDFIGTGLTIFRLQTFVFGTAILIPYFHLESYIEYSLLFK